jgi:hypothetical protein
MTRPAGRSKRLSPPAIGFPALTVVTSSARSHLAATSCHTTAGAGRRGEGGRSSLCREWSAPNSLRDRPEPSDRNKRLPRYRDWQRPLSGCRLRGVADRSGASSAYDCHRPRSTRSPSRGYSAADATCRSCCHPATFPLEYRKPVMTSAKLLLQPAANAGELGSVFTNQKRSARPEFIEQRRFSDPRRTDYQDVATLQIKCPELFKFRISAGKRKSHIDDPERVPPSSKSLHFPYVGSRPI